MRAARLSVLLHEAAIDTLISLPSLHVRLPCQRTGLADALEAGMGPANKHRLLTHSLAVFSSLWQCRHQNTSPQQGATMRQRRR